MHGVVLPRGSVAVRYTADGGKMLVESNFFKHVFFNRRRRRYSVCIPSISRNIATFSFGSFLFKRNVAHF